MRIIKFAALTITALLLGTAVLLVVGLPAGFLVGKIQTQFAADTGYRLDIAGGARLTLFPQASVVVREITVSDPADPSPNPFRAESARVDLALSTLFSGAPKITTFVLTKPVFTVPLTRTADERKPAAPAAAKSGGKPVPDIERVALEDGSVLFVSGKDKVESRIDHINVSAAISQPAHVLEASIDARMGQQALRFAIKGKAPIEKLTQDVMPIELTVEAPGFLQDKLTGTANLLTSGTLLKINDVTGSIGRDGFSGWCSVDFAGKPRVKLDLDFKRLALAATPPADAAALPSNLGAPWSTTAIDLDGLNFVDAQVAFTATELAVSTLRMAPVFVEASLRDGVMNLAISDTGLYEGKAAGVIIIDASKPELRQSMQMDLTGVRALPMLSAFADFRGLDGLMLARLDVRAFGASPRAIMETLTGTADVNFKDGEIRSVNIAQMLRSLTQNTVKGWNENKTEKTDLTELSALFRIDAGRAATDNLKIVGPLVRVNGTGAADLAAKTLDFKLDTKLVMTLEGQGASAADPVGFGVPVMVQGSWAAPEIYPDVAGILDNPDAAYGKLREMGAGLLGGGKDGKGGSDFMQGLGNLLGGKPTGAQTGGQPAPGGKPAASGDKPAAPGDKPAAAQDNNQALGDLFKNFMGNSK